ncbi:MAG TPA: CDP-glycerol glycerophosphotransferase family protein [Nitrospinota bacterium]|nr:CDP-glycerol glycerophosphotransferase family protein [Nitrospinota bacterium]|tara:strand:+ start:50339 stop:52336 length:1998 start_codon:yes stop_codon:yes gene_type:complete
MVKTLAFIDNFDEVEIFLKTFKSCIDKDTICIAGDGLTLKALKKNGIESKSIDNYRNQKEYEEAECSAVELAGKWFEDHEGNDFTKFDGISLGTSLKKEVFYYISYLNKAILDVSNILKHENPNKILLVNDPSLPELKYKESSLLLHKKIFQFLKNYKNYDVYISEPKAHRSFLMLEKILKQWRFEKQNIWEGKLIYYSHVALNRFIKKLVVGTVDQAKRLFLIDKNKNDSVRALTLSASDITYFGNNLIESFLRKEKSLLYYFDDENNCYFNFRIIRASTKGIGSFFENNKTSEFVSDLKLRFKKEINFQRKHPRWMFLDIPLLNFMDGYLKEIIEIRIPELIKFFQISEYTIKKKNINIVLICERWGAKRIILTQIAKRNGISVLHIPHSVEPGFKVGGKILSPLPCNIKHFPFYPTHEISGIRYQELMQVCRGISQDKLLLTGIPRFGKLKIKTQKSYYNARKRLGFSANEEIVLFALRAIAGPFYDKFIINGTISTFELSNFYELFLKQFVKRNNSRAVFKLKMFDDSTEWLVSNFKSRDGINSISIYRNHLHDLLTASDVVVVTHSNVGIEAIYYDTPVIVYNKPGKPSFLPLCAEKVAIEIKSPLELTPALDRLRNDKSFKEERLKIQRNFLKRNLPDDDLSSAERVVNVISQLAKKTS